MNLLENEIEAIREAKKLADTIPDVSLAARVDMCVDELIKVIGRVDSRLDKSNKRIKQLEQELSECNSHRTRLIESAMEAWGRIDDQEGSR
jgi:hypothetical protein